ncbi:MAG: hypothetical protein EXR73_12550 [Myxococcales bacterium]|nr:hypothetical protein [Myxococcales bacterium]
MRLALVTGLVVAAVAAAYPQVARAAKPEQVFAGRVMMSSKSFPLQAKSPAAYIAAVKKQSVTVFAEDTENKRWKIYYAAFFKQPVNDLEIAVEIYRQDGSAQVLVESYQQYLAKRGERVVIGSVNLQKGENNDGYPPNSRITIFFKWNGKTLASGTATITGEGRSFSGKVVFTEEEARGKKAPPSTPAAPNHEGAE